MVHQTLVYKGSAIDKIPSLQPQIGSKDSYTDWTRRELQHLLSSILEYNPSPLCIFIDGLDEVSDGDGHSELLDTIDEIRRHKHVKVCVSSRPETRFIRRLEIYQHLRVQDLTETSMRNFLEGTLLPCCRSAQVSSNLERKLKNELIERSEGVCFVASAGISPSH